MRKSNIEVKGPADSPLVQLDTLSCTDAFVDNYKTLYIVVTAPGCRDNSLIKCLKLDGNRGSITFQCDTLVQPVDIKIEWSYRDTDTSTSERDGG
jgi:hypothetical protein